MIEYVFLSIVFVLSLVIYWICRNKNAWDVMLFNTTLAVVILFMIGLMENSLWDEIVYVLGAIATGTAIAGILKTVVRKPKQ